MPYMRNEGRRWQGWHSICKGVYARWFHSKCAKLSKEEYQPALSCVPISQVETTLNRLSSEIQKIKEMMDQDTRHKNSEKLLHEKIKEQAEQIQQLETKL